MTNTLPTITSKQQAILKLLYKYRFLNRKQIQELLGHKDKRRIISWLKDLREKECIGWHYDATNFTAKSQPAIYYLSLNGIRYLRSLNLYPAHELRKRYKEPTRTQVFINQCLLVADSCLTVQSKSNDAQQYTCVVPAEYVDPASEYHYLNELKPHLLFSKHQDETTINYLLENISASLPRYQLRKRLKDYVEYLTDGWSETNGSIPVALFMCPTVADLLYVKRRVRVLMDEHLEDGNTHIRVTTLDKIHASGITSMIWEEV